MTQTEKDEPDRLAHHALMALSAMLVFAVVSGLATAAAMAVVLHLAFG